MPQLLEAWQRLGAAHPAQDRRRRAADRGGQGGRRRARPAIEYLGRRPLAEYYELLGAGPLLRLPLDLVRGLPAGDQRVLRARHADRRLGDRADRRGRGRTAAPGCISAPATSTTWSPRSTWLLDHPAEQAALRQGARAEFEAKYTAEDNRAQLLAIYQRALASGRGHPAPSAASSPPGRHRAVSLRGQLSAPPPPRPGVGQGSPRSRARG